MTVGDALREAERRLRGAGVESAAFDAEILLRHVSGWDRGRVIATLRDELPPALEQSYRELIATRAEHRPIQHLTGHQAFWRHDFLVSPAVLIPRPETELLVETALERLTGRRSPIVVDVGTGSGCIAVSIAAERPDARVFALDISPEALALARTNAERAGVADRVTLLHGDLLAPLPGDLGAVDVIVSNPPYVDTRDRDSLPPEVREHEPALALFAPHEPYSVYKRLIPAAAAHLRPGGHLLMEMGMGMADMVAQLCRDAGFTVDAVRSDLQGIPRMVSAARSGSS